MTNNATRTCYGFEIDGVPYVTSDTVERKIKAEREACAKLIEGDNPNGVEQRAFLAAAIRMRV